MTKTRTIIEARMVLRGTAAEEMKPSAVTERGAVAAKARELEWNLN